MFASGRRHGNDSIGSPSGPSCWPVAAACVAQQSGPTRTSAHATPARTAARERRTHANHARQSVQRGGGYRLADPAALRLSLRRPLYRLCRALHRVGSLRRRPRRRLPRRTSSANCTGAALPARLALRRPRRTAGKRTSFWACSRSCICERLRAWSALPSASHAELLGTCRGRDRISRWPPKQ